MQCIKAKSETAFVMPTRRETVEPDAMPAAVVYGHEITRAHLQTELDRWSSKDDWVLVSPEKAELMASKSEVHAVVSMQSALSKCNYVVAILAPVCIAGQNSETVTHYICVLYLRSDKKVIVFDSSDFEQEPTRKLSVGQFVSHLNQASAQMICAYICMHTCRYKAQFIYLVTNLPISTYVES